MGNSQCTKHTSTLGNGAFVRVKQVITDEEKQDKAGAISWDNDTISTYCGKIGIVAGAIHDGDQDSVIAFGDDEDFFFRNTWVDVIDESEVGEECARILKEVYAKMVRDQADDDSSGDSRQETSLRVASGRGSGGRGLDMSSMLMGGMMGGGDVDTMQMLGMSVLCREVNAVKEQVRELSAKIDSLNAKLDSAQS